MKLQTHPAARPHFVHYRKLLICVASLGGHNILPNLIFHQAFIKLCYTNIENTLLEKKMKGVLLFLSKITCKQSLDPDDELVLNTFGSFCNFLVQSLKKSLKNQ